ncbi:hypothetical protein CDD82_140 [Ophiocordyceps australis]|uniref:Uncharacterized protein n=1 Tax=Ophiocordyceps australis TaxID=1399860 RepID=A0A2C5YQ02_9HYPO|nr:hypothetical protein CDD82_140 [Ophiocordyceps australis]
MGVDTKRTLPLPAPTETDIASPTDLATDVSKPGDEKSSYSLPDDGTPVTIRTRGHKSTRSQTSLLIEYFEGTKTGPASDRKPSVRVRLTPSKKNKGDHIQVTETRGSRKASSTRRIPLDEAIASREIDLPETADANSMTSYASATEESNVSRNPIDIEIDRTRRRRRPSSPLIPSTDSYQPGNPSEISAIPTDSFLDGSGPLGDSKRSKSPLGFAAGSAVGVLASGAMGEISSNKARGKERAKVSDGSKDKPERKRRSKSRTNAGISEPGPEDSRHSRRRSSRENQDSNISAAESSILSSNLSPSHRSLDTRSSRSGVSKTSINNPKLLETVEDAIRRLILPELSALKREQSKREGRQGSLTSTATSSRDDVSSDRRRSSANRTEHSRDDSRYKSRKSRDSRSDYDGSSAHTLSRDSVDADYQDHGADGSSSKRSSGFSKSAVTGAARASLVKSISAALEEAPESPDKRQRDRRRRRTDSARSRSLGRDRFSGEYEDGQDGRVVAPPMPLMSEINPSELTRTSILSAMTDRPHSATEELISGGDASEVLDSPATMVNRPRTSAVDLQQTLGTKLANVSHGDLTALPRIRKEFSQDYETEDYGCLTPMNNFGDYQQGRETSEDYAEEEEFEDQFYNHQDVPPPLRYVPYQAGARGLSPIPSVSGYTEGGSEVQRPLSSRGQPSPNALSSPSKSVEQGRNVLSVHSQDSMHSSKARSEAAHQATAETGTWSHGQVRPAAAGQTVRGLGANPSFVHPPMGVESAVASLVDGSMLDQSVITGLSGSYEHTGTRGATMSSGHDFKAQYSRDANSSKESADSGQACEQDRQTTPQCRSRDGSQDFFEYEIDEDGRKVPHRRHRHSPTASEAAITAGAVGAAAAALKAAQEKRQATAQDGSDQGFEPAGVSRNKSFKERAMQGWEPRNTPAHSVDRLDLEDVPQLGASSVPDAGDPMPDVEYVEDGYGRSNSFSAEQGLDQGQGGAEWSGRATPTQQTLDLERLSRREAEGRDLSMDDMAGAAAALPDARKHDSDREAYTNDELEDDYEWRRTSAERKRDTLITNPYEDASPIVNAALGEGFLGGQGLDVPFHGESPGYGGGKYDEGYMSNGPNRTPDVDGKGKGIDYSNAHYGDVDDGYIKSQHHHHHLSGMSQGMPNSLYDAATGSGMDRIENKDIVALMQHLMVRDAQRSARDTEIVALLMNAALEMRNSFREMKELVQDTGDDVIFCNSDNTEKLQRSINGPRPYPGAASRSMQSALQADEAAAKKKNVWRRALQGLSSKGTNDLSRIEDMLMQLLGQVDVLKTQTTRAASASGQGQSFDNGRPESRQEQQGGAMSPASYASQSGHLMASQGWAQSQGSMGKERKLSNQRISIVEEKREDDEDEDQEDDYSAASPSNDRARRELLAGGRGDGVERGGSVPLETPPRLSDWTDKQPLSAESTPREDKSKKHRSGGSSGWLPKISRWSESKASSMGRVLRGGASSKKPGQRPHDVQLAASRSGSSLASHEDKYRHEAYGDDGLPSGLSDGNAVAQGAPSPVLHMTPEDPKYKAHRNSVNLQHPQPRSGQTERFRRALETSAQEFSSPLTPRSADWAGSATSLNRLPANTNRYSQASSAGADRDYWNSSPSPGHRAKEPLDSRASQTTPKPTRCSKLKDSNSPPPPQQQQSSESGYGTLTATQHSHYSGSSPRPENRSIGGNLAVPARRPTGPRAMTPKGAEDEAAREERRRKRDTFGTVTSADGGGF